MTCREFAEFIADYLSGELSGDTTAQFEHHVSRCANCAAYLANYRETLRLGRQAFAEPDAPLPDEVPEDLVKAILSLRRS